MTISQDFATLGLTSSSKMIQSLKFDYYEKIPTKFYNIKTNKGKPLSEKAIRLLCILKRFYAKVEDGTDAFTSYPYLIKVLKKSQDQIKRYLDELKDAGLGNFTFKRKLQVNSKILYNVLHIFFSDEALTLLGICHNHSPQVCGEHNIVYNKENDIKSRSSESSFFEKNELEGNADRVSCHETTFKVSEFKPQNLKSSKTTLREFLPVTEPEANDLQYRTGRKFSAGYINKLLQKLCGEQKYKGHSFYNREIFLKYVEKLLVYEMRDAVKVSNENFRFKGDNELSKQEEYLAKIENSMDHSPFEIFRRNIASRLEPKAAYDLLQNIKKVSFEKNEEKTHESDSPLEGVRKERVLMEIEFYKNVELTKTQEEMIKLEAEVAYDVSVKTMKWSYCGEKSKKLEIGRGDYTPNLDESSLWGKVRRKLIDRYGLMIDKAWFSKLESEEELSQDGRKFILKAPTKFIGSWISEHYKDSIDQYCSMLNCKPSSIICE